MERVLLLLIVLQILSIPLAGQTTSNSRMLAFVGVSVIDIGTGRLMPEMTVLISGERIIRLVKANKARIPKNAQVVDAKGKFLIPGLWDMHVHVDDAGEWMFPLLVANGVTGVRDLGSNVKQIPVWKEMQRGGAIMPKVVAAGPIVSGKIGDNDPRMLLVGNRAEAIKAIDELAAQGVDFIKVHDWISREAYFGLIEEAKRKNLPVAGHQPVALTATEISNLGQKSVEHFGNAWGGLMIDCSSNEAVLRKEAQALIPLAESGVNPGQLFEKQGKDWQKRLADSFDSRKAEQLARTFKRNKTWFNPTIYGFAYVWSFVKEADVARDARLKYMPLEAQKMAQEAAQNSKESTIDWEKQETQRRFYQNQLNLVRAMKGAGVGILAGTDATPFPPIFPGFSLHDELEKLVEAGLTPLEALQTATINPAKFFDKPNEQGSISVGKRADVILLDANPLENIRNTRRINAVVLNGKYLDRTALNEMLQSVQSANNKK